MIYMDMDMDMDMECLQIGHASNWCSAIDSNDVDVVVFGWPIAILGGK